MQQQLDFLAEIDRLKTVLRRNTLADRSRRENAAEHSWHVSLFALILAEHANARVDVNHVVKMLLVHDLVEIDAGDTFCYDPAARIGQGERERAAADRLFARLPADQAQVFRRLWEEFEAGATPEAKFAQAVDRLQAVLLNHRTRGGTWKEFQVPREAIERRIGPIKDGSATLWEVAETLLHEILGPGGGQA